MVYKTNSSRPSTQISQRQVTRLYYAHMDPRAQVLGAYVE
jgi:hypothetical protein